MNNGDFVAFLHILKQDITKAVEHGSRQNYGLLSDQLNSIYLNLANLEAMASGPEIGEDEEPLVLDATGGILDEVEDAEAE